MNKEHEILVQLGRLALTGRREDILLFLRRHAHKLRSTDPEAADALQRLTAGAAGTRGVMEAIPTDADSRLELLRREDPVILPVKPIWTDAVAEGLRLTIAERAGEARLFAAGLAPTRSLLFAGPPGVGKTLAARYLAAELDRPLLTLDLSAVMSSFLGRTGNNVRVVLDYAQRTPVVLLLDEFDAIAKRRDDVTEVGELKRLVTVLLQAVDQWPSSGVLVAATNHPDLLDPAIWRRFDRVIEFPLPPVEAIEQAVRLFLGPEHTEFARPLARLLKGSSFSAIERDIMTARRRAVVEGSTVEECLRSLFRTRAQSATGTDRRTLAMELSALGWSQRQVSDVTGVSRDTLRKAARS